MLSRRLLAVSKFNIYLFKIINYDRQIYDLDCFLQGLKYDYENTDRNFAKQKIITI